jgi:hypothetical protein
VVTTAVTVTFVAVGTPRKAHRAQIGFTTKLGGNGRGHLNTRPTPRVDVDGDLSEATGAARLPQQTKGSHDVHHSS